MRPRYDNDYCDHTAPLAHLPRVVHRLKRKRWSADEWGGVLGEHAAPFCAGVACNALLVDPRGRVLLGEGPDHAAVVLRVALVVQEKATAERRAWC